MFHEAGKWLSIAALAAGMAACDESPVSLPEPTSVAAAAAELRLTVGDAVTLPGQLLDQNGQPIRGLMPSFTSDNPGVVSVDAQGNVRAVSPGTATVTSSYGGATATTRVTVARDERTFVRTLEVMADSVVTDIRGGQQALALRVLNGFGQQVCPPVMIQVADRSVAEVTSGAGCRLVVDPNFAGRTTVTVSADGASDTFTLVVTSTGATALLSARPTAAELRAGNTVSYSVRVLDETGSPVANRAVNFDVSAGRLNTTTATTNAQGVATVQWVLPTNLRELGSNHSITFSTQLPNGQVVTNGESVFVNGASLVSVVLVREQFDPSVGARFVPVTESSISARTFETVYLGARGEDEFGNPRLEDFTFTVTAPAQKFCGDSQFAGVERTCIYSNSAGTATFTATLPATAGRAAITKSVNVVFAS